MHSAITAQGLGWEMFFGSGKVFLSLTGTYMGDPTIEVLGPTMEFSDKAQFCLY